MLSCPDVVHVNDALVAVDAAAVVVAATTQPSHSVVKSAAVKRKHAKTMQVSFLLCFVNIVAIVGVCCYECRPIVKAEFVYINVFINLHLYD